MPIQQSIPSPYNGETLQSWSCDMAFAVDMDNRVIRLTYYRYADRDSSYAGKPPIARHDMTISGDDFARLMAENVDIFNALKAKIDAYALTRPEFAGGTEVD
jgi:hypothetical protein